MCVFPFLFSPSRELDVLFLFSVSIELMVWCKGSRINVSSLFHFVHLNENTSFNQCDDSSPMVHSDEFYFTRSIQICCEPVHSTCSDDSKKKGDENEKRKESNKI